MEEEHGHDNIHSVYIHLEVPLATGGRSQLESENGERGYFSACHKSIVTK